MSALIVPPYDPSSADADLLDAFAKVMAARVALYSYDGLPQAEQPTEIIEKAEADQSDGEAVVFRSFATTAAGILARLQVLLVDVDQSRWVDKALARHGLLAVAARKHRLEGNACQVLLAATELLHMDWNNALAAYETASKNFNLALILKEKVETFEYQMRGSSITDPFLGDLITLVDTFDEAFCDDPQVRQLIRTLAPTHEALSLKLQLAEKEGVGEYAIPWIARDVEFLAGLSVDDVNADLCELEGDR